MTLKLLWATDGWEHAKKALPLLEALLLPVAESMTVLLGDEKDGRWQSMRWSGSALVRRIGIRGNHGP